LGCRICGLGLRRKARRGPDEGIIFSKLKKRKTRNKDRNALAKKKVQVATLLKNPSAPEGMKMRGNTRQEKNEN